VTRKPRICRPDPSRRPDPTTPLYLVGGGSTSSWEGTCIVYDDREPPDEERVARRDRDDADP